jgi:hypothetical protein
VDDVASDVSPLSIGLVAGQLVRFGDTKGGLAVALPSALALAARRRRCLSVKRIRLSFAKTRSG